jgi:hypothetical protein
MILSAARGLAAAGNGNDATAKKGGERANKTKGAQSRTSMVAFQGTGFAKLGLRARREQSLVLHIVEKR